MYLAPEGQEIEIADAAAGFLGETMAIERLHGADAADMNAVLRNLLGDMGWFALAVPEADGGSGLSAVEHALFFREVGRQCGPVDILAQCLASNVASTQELRTALMSGQAGVALLVVDAEGYRAIGSPASEWGLLVSNDEARLYLIGDLPRTARPSLDPANSLGTISSLPDPAASMAGERIWRLGQLGAAAMLVGIAEAALDLIVEYAKVRETFGRKIGAYQAVRHPCADMAVRVEAARSQLWYAATAFKEGRIDASVHLDAAKHIANQTALANSDTNIQLHGGIGVTEEHNAHLLLKHTMLLARIFGSKRALLGSLLHAHLDD
ncbi:acyl-CoA dehydrogenase family protein [Novosphingobium sp. G106]|uniref:acyl-CoA dehydrogenase family protein n=1 Tax=Novosphingobium sp. G106 TaxID=2849500 RepID=UPI001C2D35B8|nr:acyl-CoA dehydrogenase [Novosphingobium sp. G106]MBV1687930.1 acyl-CoA dehydrogenase family protein [Novosphingobium sp. G106]